MASTAVNGLYTNVLIYHNIGTYVFYCLTVILAIWKNKVYGVLVETSHVVNGISIQ